MEICMYRSSYGRHPYFVTFRQEQNPRYDRPLIPASKLQAQSVTRK
jgi:hypothetical protein